jgi:CobQ-like glutamine amidotransferase family enzyme
MKIIIGHLYPDLMNMYGDRGNIIALVKRCQWRNIEVEVKNIYFGKKFDTSAYDLVFMGGGQDKEQRLVAEDFQKIKGKDIKKAANNKLVILGICGGYQLFGKYYKTSQGDEIPGIGILDVYTEAGQKRMIGNSVININQGLIPRTQNLTTLVGFENHSGQTFLGKKAKPLGTVKIGYGNNGESQEEGACENNVFGTYLHGSFLPKNPHFADFLITLALNRKHGPIDLKPLDDDLEIKAHKAALKIAKKKKTVHL